MNRTWMLAVAMVTAMEARTESPEPQADTLLTIITYNRVDVPAPVMARAKRVANAAFAVAGVEVRWVEGKRLGERREAAGEVFTVVFDGPAPARFTSDVMAFTNLGGRADADVHIFYDRVAAFGEHLFMPELLGNVLAHELTHALEGVARHSREGLMKACWSASDYAEMVHGPLAFAAVDLGLLRAHFHREISPAPRIATSAPNAQKDPM